MTSMIVGAKGGRTESQEEILTPRNRVLVRQDVVSWTSFRLYLFEIVGRWFGLLMIVVGSMWIWRWFETSFNVSVDYCGVHHRRSSPVICLHPVESHLGASTVFTLTLSSPHPQPP